MAIEYLVDAANDMYRIISQDGENTPAQVARAAARGCSALRRLQDDQTFRRSVRQLGQARQDNPEEFQGILGQHGESWEQFDGFLVQERAVLLIAGVEPGLIEELITQGREYIGRARDWHGNANQLFGLIAQLRDRACGLATQLEEAQSAAQLLAQSAERIDRLNSLLEQAHVERKVAIEDLAVARQQIQQLNAQAVAAQQSSQDVANQLAETGPVADPRGRSRVIWRITYGIGGIVVIATNTAAIPLFGPVVSAASAAIGNALVSMAVTNQ